MALLLGVTGVPEREREGEEDAGIDAGLLLADAAAVLVADAAMVLVAVEVVDPGADTAVAVEVLLAIDNAVAVAVTVAVTVPVLVAVFVEVEEAATQRLLTH